jgi:hypothetical protein
MIAEGGKARAARLLGGLYSGNAEIAEFYGSAAVVAGPSAGKIGL